VSKKGVGLCFGCGIGPVVLLVLLVGLLQMCALVGPPPVVPPSVEERQRYLEAADAHLAAAKAYEAKGMLAHADAEAAHATENLGFASLGEKAQKTGRIRPNSAIEAYQASIRAKSMAYLRDSAALADSRLEAKDEAGAFEAMQEILDSTEVKTLFHDREFLTPTCMALIFVRERELKAAQGEDRARALVALRLLIKQVGRLIHSDMLKDRLRALEARVPELRESQARTSPVDSEQPVPTPASTQPR